MLDDDVRLRLLLELDLDDGDDALDAIAVVAAQICGTPMAAVTLVGRAEQVFVGSVGLGIDRSDLASSFCAVAMQSPGEALLVPDTHRDARFAHTSLVVGDPHIRSYAGVPLMAAEHIPLGAVCVLSDQPYALSPAQLAALRALGAVTERLLDARRTSRQLTRALDEVSALRVAEKLSQEQFGTAFDHSPHGMTVADESGIYVRVNRAFAALLGHAVDDVTGRHFRDLTDPGDEAADVAAIGELLAGRTRAALREKRYRHRDGRLIPALVSSSLIRFEPGGPWLLLTSVESLEERRAAEEKLLELHSAVDGIISIDEHGRIVAWNLGAERLLGYRAAQMLGNTLDRIIPAASRPAHNAGVARVAAGGEPHLVGSTVEVPAVHADGRELLTELSLSSWSLDGQPRYTAILRDITAQRRTEICTALVRHAALTANDADSFPTAAADIMREVCSRLGWAAGHAWMATAQPAVWHLGEHTHHDPDAACALTLLAAQGAAPAEDLMPFNATTRVATAPEHLAPMGAAVQQCRISAGVAVPVLAGGDVAGMLAFYLPTGTPAPVAEVVTALEQVGLALGRIVERQRTQTTLTWQAHHDPVTDLANRRLLLEQISQAQSGLGAEPARHSAVLLINLDRFRLINDSLGYAVGDHALRKVADRLRDAVGPGDLVARLSADEFVVLAHAGDPDDRRFVELAEHLLDALHLPLNLVRHSLHLRASIGVRPITAQDRGSDHNPAAVLRDADAALRQAKRRGKDQIHVFDATLRTTADRRMADETALAHAISAGELVVYYQPIITLETGTPAGAEALVRWQRPGRGLIAPDLFIPLAEDSGLIIDLGRWVLRQACRDAANWPVTVPVMAEASVSVNVSARQLTHPRFLTDLDDALRDSGLPANRLVIEITETAVIEDLETGMDTLHAIRGRGAQVALDDFGTGYSSMSYVKNLPATILKIDKSFVDPITGPGDGTALSEVVLKLAEATDMHTVAEGVETPAQAAALHLLGCQRGQGYHWARPVPQDQLNAVVSAMGSGVAAVPVT